MMPGATMPVLSRLILRPSRRASAFSSCRPCLPKATCPTGSTAAEGSTSFCGSLPRAPGFRLEHLEEEVESANISDPLEGLIESAGTDPGTPFQPDVLERLAALKEQDRAAFETLRSQLKKVGCRVTALDEACAGESGETGGRQSQADILIELTRSAELFHTPDGTAFADLDVNGHRETWPIRTKGFRRWLTRR